MYEFSIFISLLIYILLIGLATFFMYIANRTENNDYLIIVYLIITLPSLLRYCVGIDYEPYLNLYYYVNEFDNITSFLIYHEVEKSFVFLSVLAAEFSLPIIVFAFYSIFTQLFMVCGIWYFRRWVSPTFLLFLYLLSFYWRTYNIFRQSLAISIIFFAIKYVFQEKIINYIVCVLVASCFHNTAIIAILVYFIYNIKPKKVHIKGSLYFEGLIIFCGLVFLQPLMNTVFSIPFLSTYGNSYNQIYSFDFQIGMVSQAFLYFLYFYFNKYRKNNLSTKENEFLTRAVLMSIAEYILLYRVFFASRIGLYFSIFSLVSFASIHDKNSKIINREKANLSTILIIFYYIYQFVKIMAENSYGQLPYSIWIL